MPTTSWLPMKSLRRLTAFVESKHPKLLQGLTVLWLLLICWLAFFWHLGSIGLVDETEPLFAEAARQMLVTGDWVTPIFNGEPRFDKPPLVYWLMAIAYRLFGVNEWAVRLPSALAATGLTSLGCYTLWRFGAPAAELERRTGAVLSNLSSGQQPVAVAKRWPLSAWLGAAMIALNLETIAWARTGVSDMLLSGCMGSALLAFFHGYAETKHQKQWYLAFYSFTALAVLAKGPVGLVLPGLILGAFLLYLGNGRAVLQEMDLLRGSLVSLALTLPWYGLVIQANGMAYVQSFFGYHNLERFTGVVNHHAGPWYFYVLVVLGGFAPWSVYLPVAIAQVQVWQRRRWRGAPRSTHLALFALFWFLGVFGFFTLAVTKLPSYVLPLMPAAAILVALFWSQLNDRLKPPGFGLQITGLLNVLLFLALAAAIFSSPRWLNDPTLPNLSLRLQQSGVLTTGGLIWATAAILGVLTLLRGQARWLWSLNFVSVVACVLLVVMPSVLILDAERQLPLRKLAHAAVQVQQPEEELIMLGFKKPSLVFYTQRPITYLASPEAAIAALRPFNPPDPATALVLSAREDLARTGLKAGDYQAIATAGIYQLVRTGQAR